MTEYTVKSESELAKAIAAFDSVPGRINLAGEWDITSPVLIYKPISLNGLPGHKIRIKTSVGRAFIYMGSLGATRAINPTSELSEYADVQLGEHDIKRGDIVMVQADNALPMWPHIANGRQCPAEVHMVHHVTGNRLYLADTIQDPLTDSPRLYKPSFLSDFSITNLNLESASDGAQHDYACSIQLDRCRHVRIENVHINREGSGGILIRGCYDVQAHGIAIDGSQAADLVYGIVVGASNGVTISENVISGCRHAITSTCELTSGTWRYGNGLNVNISRNIINVPTRVEGSPTSTRVGIDTHIEGIGWRILHNTVNCGNLLSNVGIQTRSRRTEIIGNSVRGKPAMTRAIRTLGSDTIIAQNVIDGAWLGITAEILPGTENGVRPPDCRDAIVKNNIFRDVSGYCIDLSKGTGHQHEGSTYERCILNPINLVA